MNNILNAQEAFAALQKGKTVLCRYAGNGNLHADKNFSTLDQMPATVFVLPNYEFCIKIETIELAGITFTKPITIDEYQDDQEVFVICTYSPSIYVMNFKTNALIESINAGFVQRDAENAELQLKAISKALGREFNGEVTVTRLGKESSKSKRKKEPEPVIKSANDDNSLDDIIGPVSEQSLPQVGEPIKTQSSDYCDTLDEQLEFVKLRDDLLNRTTNGKTPAEVNALARYTRTWTEEQRAPLLRAMHKRLEELQSQGDTVQQEPPSLMVQIQNAPDLTTLDALEIDVSARHPDIQPRLMGYVKKRRYELEQIESAANDEALP